MYGVGVGRVIRIGFSARPLEKGLKNPRPDGLGDYRRTIDIIKACKSWGLRYYNMPPETIGWGDYSKYQPNAREVKENFSDLLGEINRLSLDSDIKLSFHVRSSVVLTSPNDNIRAKSVKEVSALRKGLEIAGGLIVYIHPGYAHDDENAAKARLASALNSLPESPVSVGIETNDVGISGLDAVLELCDMTRGTVPVVDWGHLWGLGCKLETPEDYISIILQAEPYWHNYVFFHFSAVWKRKHLPLDLNLPDYRIFAEAVKMYAHQSDKEVIVLIESPLRENDALLVQKIALSKEEELLPVPSIEIGSYVTLEDMATGEVFEVILVDEAIGMNDDKVSLTSPVGKAIVNRHTDEVVTVAVPGEELQYRIVEIKSA